MRILIVDDDELLAYLLADQLHRHDKALQTVAVTTADAARAAVLSAVLGAAGPFDVFLIDQLLSGSDVDGVMLMQELSQLNGSGDTILFTGQDDPAAAYKAMEYGAYRYLFKPFDTRELVLILKGLAAFQQVRREHNWLKILAEASISLQQRSTIAEIADATARCALQLGFERVRLWRFVEYASDTLVFRGLWQVGHPSSMQLDGLEIPLQEFSHHKEMLSPHPPEIYYGQQSGFFELERRFPGVFCSPQGQWAALPLFAGKTLIGALSLDNVNYPRSFNMEQRDILRIFAAQVSAALARAFQQEKEAEETQERRTLDEMGRRITEMAASGSLDNLLCELREQAARLMDVSNFLVALVEPDTAELLDFRFHCVQNEIQPRKWHPHSDGLIRHLIEKNEPLWFPNAAEADYRLHNHILPVGEMSQCWLGVPLRVEGRAAIGAVVVQDAQYPYRYTQRHQQMWMALTEQIAGAIELTYQREREQARRQRGEFLDAIKGHLHPVIQENEDWFWHLVLKFVTDAMGLRFNRALVFLRKEDERVCWRGRLGIGHLEAGQARCTWETLAERTVSVKEWVKEFVKYLRVRCEEEGTPLEQKVSGWQLAEDGGVFWQKIANKPVCVAAAELSDYLAEPYLAGFTDLKTAVCVVAPILTGDDLAGILIADNAFTDEPVRLSLLDELANLLLHVGQLWNSWCQKQQELTSSEREQVAGLRQQVLSQMQYGEDLKRVLEQICGQTRLLLRAASVVIYPMDKGSIAYRTEKIACAGLEYSAIDVISTQPRHNGMHAHIRRVGKVLISDVRSSPLVFDDVPVQQHAFIQKHNVRAFIGMALLSHATKDPLGILLVNYATVHPFDRHHEELVEQLAEIACQSIGAAHGSAAMEDQHRTQELNRLRYVLEAALAPDADDNKAIGALLANTKELLSAADRVELMVMQEKRDGCGAPDSPCTIYRNIPGKPPEKVESTLSENPVAQRVCALNGPFLATHFEAAAGDLQSVLVSSAVAAPVYHHNKIFGVLSASAACPDAFFERDQKRIVELAGAAGLVIGSLYRRKGLLRGVLDAAEEITRLASLEMTLQSVVKHSFEAAPDLDCVTIWYYQPGSARLVRGPRRGLQGISALTQDNPVERVLVDQIVRQPEAVWVPDVRKNSVFGQSSFLNDEQIVSVAAFPLSVNGVVGALGQKGSVSLPARDFPLSVNGVVGALFFYYRVRHEFTQEEKDVFPIFAAIAAAATHQTQLLELSERRKRRLEDALKVTKAVEAYWEQKDILPALLNALRDHFSPYLPGAAPCWLAYNVREGCLELPEEVRNFYHAMPGVTEFVPILLDAPDVVAQVASDCIRSEQTVVKNWGNLHNKPGLGLSDSTECSELCAGLWRNQSLLGVLVLRSPKRDAFSKEDQELFELVAEQIAAAIERANQVARKHVDDILTRATAWAAELAHDINVDINYIRNRAYWLRERMPEVTTQGRQWAKEIDERAAVLANKARDERAERAYKVLPLAGFLEEKIREWQVRACTATEIVYEWEDTSVCISVYPDQLWRVVRHLLRNAVEAMGYRGKIWLRLRLLPSNCVELLVENNGPDLSPIARQQLFHGLYSSKPNGHERGMGLLLAKKLIEQMDGILCLLPAKPGRGPVFALQLPRSREERSAV
jgi:GAF domain-containing protein